MQNQHNAIYREEEREMMPTCKHFGIGVIPWGPMGGGREYALSSCAIPGLDFPSRDICRLRVASKGSLLLPCRMCRSVKEEFADKTSSVSSVQGYGVYHPRRRPTKGRSRDSSESKS